MESAHSLTPAAGLSRRHPNPVLVLGIETATDVCAVALLLDGAVVFARSQNEPRRHAERLAPMLAEALGSARSFRSEMETQGVIDGIAVSAGPGSYTGLRIGVSSAKGVALALGVPIAGVSTLAALAAAAAGSIQTGVIVAAMHARADEWYVATFEAQPVELDDDRGSVSSVRERSEPAILAKTDLIALLESTSGTLVVPSQDADPSPNIPNTHRVSPSAVHVARIGANLLREGLVCDLESFEPTYLREFVPRRAKRGIFNSE